MRDQTTVEKTERREQVYKIGSLCLVVDARGVSVSNNRVPNGAGYLRVRGEDGEDDLAQLMERWLEDREK